MRRTAAKIITKGDQDGDGKISWDEIKIFDDSEEKKAWFQSLDFNKDGNIDQEEVTKYLTDCFMQWLFDGGAKTEEESI